MTTTEETVDPTNNLGAPPPPPAPAAPEPPEPRQTLGRGGQPLSEEAVSERLRREKKKILKEFFGTDDEKKIDEHLASQKARDDAYRQKDEELARLRSADDERKRAQMSEVEKVQSDLAAARAEVERLKGELAKKDRELLTQKMESQLIPIAVRHGVVEPESIDYLRVVVAKHYRQLSRRDQADFEGRQLERFVRDWAKEHPRFCTERGAAPKPADPPATRTVRKPLGGGKPPNPPPAASGPKDRPPDMDENGKTTRPGLPNSMNKEELKAFAKKNGLSLGY